MAAGKVTKPQAKRRAAIVSASKLTRVIEQAAKRASATKKVKLDKETILRPGSLIGRLVRDDISIKDAQSLAANITSTVKKSSKTLGLPTAKPAVMILDKRILVGFIDPRHFDLLIDK